MTNIVNVLEKYEIININKFILLCVEFFNL